MLCRCFQCDYPSQISSKLWLLACCPLKAKVLILRHQQMVWAQVTGSAHLLLCMDPFTLFSVSQNFSYHFFWAAQLCILKDILSLSSNLFSNFALKAVFSLSSHSYCLKQKSLSIMVLKLFNLTELYLLHNEYSIKCV